MNIMASEGIYFYKIYEFFGTNNYSSAHYTAECNQS